MECCCAACSCINACCPSPRGGRDRTKYRDAPPSTPYQGYQPTPAPYYAAPTVPQFATFDTSRKVNADSLPAMPSWDTSASKRVPDANQPEELEMHKTEHHDETEPMLANSASPRIGQAGVSPYQDRPQDLHNHTQDGYQDRTTMDGTTLASMPPNQGYRSPGGERPGMSASQNSYASSTPGNQGYGQNRPQQQNLGPNAYGQQRYPSSQNGSFQQNSGNLGYGQSPLNASATGYDNNRDQHTQRPYGSSSPPQQQGYNSYNFAPASGQTLGVAPRAPQPTYAGPQEYSRPSGTIPVSLAPGPGARSGTFNGQQPYRTYENNQYQGQGQSWKDV